MASLGTRRSARRQTVARLSWLSPPPMPRPTRVDTVLSASLC